MPPRRSPRKDALLDELVELFLREGFQKFTLAELASRLRCSKSTLYGVGHSKEQATVNVVVHFFKGATELVEQRVAKASTPSDRIVEYLRAAADALRPASPAFMADVAEQPAVSAVYEKNTRIAARRVGELIADGVEVGEFRRVHAAFVADTVAHTMRRIQTGEIARSTGLGAAEAYDELALLIISGIRS